MPYQTPRAPVAPRRTGQAGALVLGIGVAAALFGIWKLRELFKAGKINPASRENIIYQAAGEPGLKIADWFPSSAERKVNEMLASPVRPAAVTTDAQKKPALSDWFMTP